ncbi:hypothetical protein B566_EDAN017225 [Ephemera danica]|nr:hypothetical protein B566_EDAN017225 [Ephemera danica]
MGSSGKRSHSSTIHRIKEFELEAVALTEHYDILQIVGEGWFAKILLAEHRNSGTEVVLKALPKVLNSISDFYREFHYSLHLGAHRNIITTYDVAFETPGFYVFAQDHAPLGDLAANVSENGGIGEPQAKRVGRQLASALDFMHSRDLVHRDLRLDNVLVFRSDFARVKLCDFGETRRSAAYKAEFHQDVWQFGVVLFVCLTGCLPWQKASPSDDPRYSRYVQWHSSATGGGPGGLLAMALVSPRRRPKLFKLLTSRAQRMFRKFLEPRSEKRSVITTTPGGLGGELGKYLEDRWLEKVSESNAAGTAAEKDAELCPSMYSFHSSPEEKNKLLKTLTEYGVETTVDRGAKKDRIRQWIQSSAIQEDEEGEEPELDNFDLLRQDEVQDGEPYEGRERRQSSSGSGTAASH